ncbi:tetratricopeptide repeat protein [Rariglobus hedericola]|nr:tetratricopeptide repeat protein [Rariglobus hedericola]
MTPDPSLAPAQSALAAGNFDDAAGLFTAALQKDAAHTEARLGLARTLHFAGLLGPALQSLAPFFTTPEISAAAPPAAWLEAALIHRAAGRFNDARLTLENAPPAVHQHPAWSINLADVLLEQGHPAASRDLLAAAPGLLARQPQAASSWLRSQLYLPEVDASQLHASSRQWARWHGGYDPIPMVPPNRELARRLRLVFVSSRLCAHNSAQQLLGILPHLDRKGFHVTLVSTGRIKDSVTEKLRTLANVWIDIPSELPDADTAKLLRDTKADILVDQQEHSNNGPISLFTRRIAPLQVHWYCNALSTGLRTLDARISDSTTEPQGQADELSSEPILRLPHGYLAYTPPHLAVAPVDLIDPARPLTLGGIPHLAKCTDAVLATWAEILRQLPHARLLLARNTLGDPATRDAFAARCHAAGIPADRLDLRPDGGAISTLAIFNDLDLILDTWPFGGEATSMDALWMGVPILTLCGDRITARRTTTLLKAVGRQDLVTTSPEAYIARAVEIASDLPALRASRAPLRAAVQASDWCNGPLIAADLAAAFRALWIKACHRK